MDYKKYVNAKENNANTYNETRRLKKEIIDLSYKTEQKIQDQIYKLESKKYRIEQKRTKDIKKMESILQKKNLKNVKILNEINKYFEYIKIYQNGDKTIDFYTYKYSNSGNKVTRIKYSPIEVLFADNYTICRAYVIPNDNKTNKLSLLLALKSIFDHNNGINRIHNNGYISNLHSNVNTTNNIVIKTFQNAKDAEKYYFKNKEKLKKLLHQYPTVTKEYNQAIKNFESSTDYKKIYYKELVDYYINCCSNYKEEPEYKYAVKQVSKLIN